MDEYIYPTLYNGWNRLVMLDISYSLLVTARLRVGGGGGRGLMGWCVYNHGRKQYDMQCKSKYKHRCSPVHAGADNFPDGILFLYSQISIPFVQITCDKILSYKNPFNAMNRKTSSNGNIFRVTCLLCGEFTGLRWIDVFFIWAWINSWINNRGASYLRRHRADYDVIMMKLHSPTRCISLRFSVCRKWHY